MISLQTNIDSLIAQQNLAINSKFQSSTIQQLTSGYRINSSGDDAAGLSVANLARNTVAQITQGVANGNNGIAQLQIMDGGMNNISQILDRLQTLAVQSASSSFTGNRADLNAEFQSDITELNRQAQAIGLNVGGTYAQIMDVYLGGGGGATTSDVSLNGQVTVDLSQSTVDAHSLGLSGMGMQVVAGTADISSNSANHSVYQIVTNASNLAGLSNHTTFYLSGAGFSDSNRVKLSVDLNGVSDISTLVRHINDAIATAAANADSSLSSAAALALSNADIAASVSTDASGGQQLAFSSDTAAFQVEAGDQMANALMGNLSTDASTPAQGLSVATTVTGAATLSGSGTAFAYSGVSVQISGAGLASPVSITFSASQNTMGTALSHLQSEVAGNAALRAAGITVTTAAAGSALVFTSATGEQFSVQATGDTANALGLGSLNNSSASSSPAFYSTITGSNYSATTNGNGLATLGFSLNGGPTDGGVPASTTASAAKIVGTAPTGINSSAQVNTAALGSSALSLSVNGTRVDIDFSHDANVGTTETLANVAKYINSQVNAAMGWGSDVHLASVVGTNANSTITLTDPFSDTNSTLTVISGGTPLGLSGTSTGTDAVGNTVTVNLAGGDATSARYTATASSAAMTEGIDTSDGGTVNFTIDGVAVAANFANDTNNVGTEAVMTGSVLGSSAASTIDLRSLLGAATLTGPGLADDGAGTALDLSAHNLSGTPLTINGTQIDISAATSLQDVVAAINGATYGSGLGVTAEEVTLGNGNYALKLTSAATGSTAGISVVRNQAAVDVGLTASTNASPVTAAGTSQSLSFNIDGGGAQTIDFSGDVNIGAGETLQQVADYINARLDAGYSTPGVQYASITADGRLQITGVDTGSADGSVSVAAGAAAVKLGLNTTGSAASVTGNDESVADVVAFLNSAAQKALGSIDTASIFSVNSAGTISIDSQTKGAVSSFSMGSNTGAGATIATALGLGSLTTVTSGHNASLSSIASTLTQDFRANTSLNKAGLQATVSGSGLNIASSNATSFRLAEYDTAAANGGSASTLGFVSNSGPFSASLTSGVSKATMLDAGGTSAIGTGSTDSPYISFAPMLYGSDTQTLTFSANSALGAQQSLSITLRNDTGAETGSRSGASIDAAVAFINSQLQASNNSTLQSIVAVKENVGGVEQINFLSSLSSFSVSVGNSLNGNGVNGGTARTFESIANGAANNAAIDTLSGAQAAVTAVTAAVQALGTAQATVGKGQNQLSYAVSLAQSQITNISAAQSQIRDANVAQQAANMTKAQVLQQATIAAMAQANQEPQAVLRLLQQ